MIRVVMPWPPTVNTYWRTISIRGHQRTLISAAGRQYRSDATMAARSAERAFGRLYVTIHAHPPDHRRRDLDNLLKAPLDALQHAGVIADDSHIDDLRIIREPVIAGGRLMVEITQRPGPHGAGQMAMLPLGGTPAPPAERNADKAGGE